jgi:hypothetical protein
MTVRTQALKVLGMHGCTERSLVSGARERAERRGLWNKQVIRFLVRKRAAELLGFYA